MTTRLYRKLPPTTSAGLFTVTSSIGSWSDNRIGSIKTIRGGGTGEGGFLPSVATVSIADEVPPADDANLAVTLTAAAATQIAAITGLTAAALRPRWAGRVGSLTVTDTPRMRTTEVTAAHWAAQIATANAVGDIAGDRPDLTRLWQKAWQDAEIPAGYGFVTVPPEMAAWDAVAFLAGDPSTKAFAWDKASTDLAHGVTFCSRRDGALVVTNLAHRKAVAEAWSALTSEPLTRRQVLSPARWVQPVSAPAVAIGQYRHATTDAIVTLTQRAGTSTRPLRPVTLDATGVRARTNTIPLAIKAAANRAAGFGYHVPEVTVDLLHLLTSPVPADRTQAGQLLTLEQGDPVTLSYDWPNEVIGVYFAETITETITPQGWAMTLGLAPAAHVTGDAIRDVPGRTWDTAYPAPTTWEETDPDTWSSHP